MKENITKCQASYKNYYDKKHKDIPLKVGNWVFVREVKHGRLTKKKLKCKGDHRVISFPTLTTCSLCNQQGHKLNDALLCNVKHKYPGLTLKMLQELSQTEDNTYDKDFVEASQPDQELPDLPEMPNNTPNLDQNFESDVLQENVEAEDTKEFKVTFNITDGGDITLVGHDDAPQGGEFTFLTPACPLSASKVITSTQIPQQETQESFVSSQPVPERKPTQQPELSASQPNVSAKSKNKLSRKPCMKGVNLQSEKNITDRKCKALPTSDSSHCDSFSAGDTHLI